jgi:hypothetical protein
MTDRTNNNNNNVIYTHVVNNNKIYEISCVKHGTNMLE